MSIRPIVFNGMMQTTQEISSIKQNENNKPAFQQQNIQTQFTKETVHQMKKVNDPNSTENQENKYDARDKGKNEYEGNRGNKKKKNLKEEGAVMKKAHHQGFDMSI